MKNTFKLKTITALDVAKLLSVEDKYLEVLAKQELRDNFIQSELRKTEEDFFNSDFVELPCN